MGPSCFQYVKISHSFEMSTSARPSKARNFYCHRDSR